MSQRQMFTRVAFAACLVLSALAPPVGAATLSYVSNPGRGIFDGDPFGAFDQILVPDNGQILDVNIDLVVGHPIVGDLIVTLQHDGVLTELWLQACGPQQDMDLTFDDEGGAVVCTTPIQGLIDPTTTSGGAGHLNVFDGRDVNGAWDIQVADVVAGGGNGTFIEWRLHVEVADPPLFVPPPDLVEPGCRGSDNPLYASPCRGGGYCMGGGGRGRGSRDHMSRMNSRASMGTRSPDAGDEDQDLWSEDDGDYAYDDESMSYSMSEEMYGLNLDESDDSSSMFCGGPVSSNGGVFRFSGEFHRSEVDMAIPGRGQDFVWSRNYRSRTGPASSMGQNWSHGYDIRVFEIDDAPSEAEQLVFQSREQLLWQPPADPAGDPAALRYCTLRSEDPQSFVAATTVVLDPEEADTGTLDQQQPAPGQLFSYLILPKNGTRPGSLGEASTGAPRVGLECGLTGPELLLADGTGRLDAYQVRQSGPLKWMAPEFLAEFTQNPGGDYTLTFADTGTWNFRASSGLPDDGKIDTIVDRNGNALTFSYDVAGNLAVVFDTLGRQLDLAYNPDGFLESVTDFTGRQVVYDYYTNGDPNGSAGDLKSVRTPIVIGSSTGNNFPSGKTTVYTYSTGFADEQLNHNLLTITDPKGQLWLQNVYSPTLDPTEIDYDRVTHQIIGDPFDRIDYVYIPTVPDPTNDFSVVRVIENDRVGNVRESLFDERNRMVRAQALTGRAPQPDQPTDDVTNRPVNPLRPTDPPFYETRWSYNDDSRSTGITFPSLSTVSSVYDVLNPDRRSQANLLSVCTSSGPLGGSQPQLCDLYEYDTPSPTSAGTNFVTRHVDARGHETLHVYDSAGNREQTTHRIPSIVENFEYNPFGQLTAYVHPDNGSAHRRRDEFTYYGNGPQTGYLHQAIIDFGNFDLTTTFEYDARGNVVRTVDPRGADSLFEVNQLDQIVSIETRELAPGSGQRYASTTYYDANDNVVRVDVEGRDETHTLFPNSQQTTVNEYDILDRVVRTCTEDGSFVQPIQGPPESPSCGTLPQSEFIVNEFEYDGNRNVVEIRGGVATDGSQPTNTLTRVYDERDLLFRTVRAAGDPDQSTSQYNYDANGNVVQASSGLEGTPRVRTMIYDGYDRLTRATDPLGNATIFVHDQNDNLIDLRVEGELIDVPGNAGNVRLYETTYVYDNMDRRVRFDTQHFDGDTQTAIGDGLSSLVTDYTDSSHVRFVTDDNGNVTDMFYDTANRLLRIEDAKGNELRYDYDANSNVVQTTSTEKSDLGTPDEVFVSTFTYDGLDRPVSSTDAAGNTVESLYDSRGNLRVTLDAKTGAGSSGNVTRMDYDGIDRLISTRRELTVDGTGGTAQFDEIVVLRSYDDSSRLIELTDDALNTTTYTYDSMDRRTVTLNPDGTHSDTSYDVHDNVVSETDPNGTILNPDYDLLDRMTRLDVTPAGVGIGGTTLETYDYDGLSRMVRATDDDSNVLRSYDSLSHVIRETLDGQLTQSFYDGVGNRIQSNYPGGRVVGTTYDSLNRPSLIQDGGVNIAEYQYVGPDRVARRVYGNGAQTLYTYDGLANAPGDFGVKQLVRTQHVDGGGTTFDDRVYSWDPMYNKLSHQDITPNGPGTLREYVYDSVYRMTSSTRSSPVIPAASTTYAYDGVGNRSSVTGGPDPGVYTLDPTSPVPADQQVNQYTQTPIDTRLYDENGNTASTTDLAGILPPVTHTYDYADRLVERSDPGRALTTTYTYDALGRRTSRVVTDPGVSTETRYYYDGHRVSEERDGAGATTATYVYGLYVDEVLQREHATFGTSYFHADDLNNTVAVTDGATGTVRERYDYEDYGRPIYLSAFGQPQPRSFFDVSYLFTGRRYDDESGLYWFRTRYLDPRAGRFTSRDTLGAWGDAGNHGNGQTYAGNNPATMVDPFGETFIRRSKVKKRIHGRGTVATGRSASGADYNSSRSNRGVSYGGGGAGGRIIVRASNVFPPFRDGDPIVPEKGLYGGGGGGGGGRIALGHFRGHGGKKDKKRIAGGGGGGGGAIWVRSIHGRGTVATGRSAGGGDYNSSRSNRGVSCGGGGCPGGSRVWPLPGYVLGGGTGSGMGTLQMGPIYVLQPADVALSCVGYSEVANTVVCRVDHL